MILLFRVKFFSKTGAYKISKQKQNNYNKLIKINIIDIKSKINVREQIEKRIPKVNNGKLKLIILFLQKINLETRNFI